MRSQAKGRARVQLSRLASVEPRWRGFLIELPVPAPTDADPRLPICATKLVDASWDSVTPTLPNARSVATLGGGVAIWLASLLLRMEHAMAPLSAYLIIPLFGFANAGVSLAGLSIAGLAAPLPLGIALGLFIGKQVGILGAIWAAQRFGLARPPAGANWPQLWGMALLCGIGFTMSLFIAQLGFPGNPALIDEAKLGVLLGSLLSALGGYLVLRLESPKA